MSHWHVYEPDGLLVRCHCGAAKRPMQARLGLGLLAWYQVLIALVGVLAGIRAFADGPAWMPTQQPIHTNVYTPSGSPSAGRPVQAWTTPNQQQAPLQPMQPLDPIRPSVYGPYIGSDGTGMPVRTVPYYGQQQ